MRNNSVSGRGGRGGEAASSSSSTSLQLTLTRPNITAAGPALSKQLGRDGHTPGNGASLGPATLRSSLLASVSSLQSILRCLQDVAARDPSELSAATYKQTEEALFNSREIGRKMKEQVKRVEDERERERKKQKQQPKVNADSVMDEVDGGEEESSATAAAVSTARNASQVCAALQSTIEKAATLLLAKHKHQQQQKPQSHPTTSFGSATAASGEKRKQTAHGNGMDSTAKRLRGSSGSVAGSATAVSPDDEQPLDARVDQVLKQVLRLQEMQAKLHETDGNGNDGTMTRKTRSAPGSHRASGSTTPIRPTHPLLTHSQSAQTPSTQRMPAPDRGDDERMDDGPVSGDGGMMSMTARSDVSMNESSMSSEGDSEQAISQRQEMIAKLADTIVKLQRKIKQEKKKPIQQTQSPAAAQTIEQKINEEGEEEEDAKMTESSTILEPSPSSQSAPPRPSIVPPLDFSSLTGQVASLEAMLSKCVTILSELVSAHDRAARRKEERQRIIAKQRVGIQEESTSSKLFARTPASSFAAKPFNPEAVKQAAAAAKAATTATEPVTFTDAARSQQAVSAAASKSSEAPRASAAIFGSSMRFAEGDTEARRLHLAKTNKVLARKLLYEKYEQLQRDVKAALAKTEETIAKTVRASSSSSATTSVQQDEVLAALAATKPKLAQTVRMGPSPEEALAASAAATKAKSLAALANDRERGAAAQREKQLGPGAYELDRGIAVTQRRVTGVSSWGPGPPTATADGEGEDIAIAPTERFVPRKTAAGHLGPGWYDTKEELTMRRVAAPKMVAPRDSEQERSIQQQRVKAMDATRQKLKEQMEMEKDYDKLDATVRKRPLGVGSLIQAPPPSEPTEQQRIAQQASEEKQRRLEAQYRVRQQRLDELAATKRAEQLAAVMHRREVFLAAERERLEREKQRLTTAAAGPHSPSQDIHPNFEFTRPRKPAFRYAAPAMEAEMRNEVSRHSKSARKRSQQQMERQAKMAKRANEKMQMVERKFREFQTLRSTAPADMARMTGRQPSKSAAPSEDKRDYDTAKSKDFIQLKHIPGADWSRAAPRRIGEPDLDPEIDDIIGGQEGDVLDLEPSDKLLRPRIPGHRFGPASGPSLGHVSSSSLQTLSDTELDYSEEPARLYPNYDFVRKRQGRGGALPFDRQYLGGTRSEGEEEDEVDEFYYLAEGQVDLHPHKAAVERRVHGGAFARRRDLFLRMHAEAKKREEAKAREESEKLVLDAAAATDALVRHKPATSFKFSARHDLDQGEEIDDMEAWGIPLEGRVAKFRGGPGEYEPKYKHKDGHVPGVSMSKQSGRLQLDDDSIINPPDERDFMGGEWAVSKNDELRAPSQMPGVSFTRSRARDDRKHEDALDFPDTELEGDRLELHPKSVGEGRVKGGINMARTTGRPPSPDELDIEANQPRLDLQNTDPLAVRKRVAGVSFAKATGRTEQDVVGEGADADLNPQFDAIEAHVPTAIFSGGDRFPYEARKAEQLLALAPDLDAATRKKVTAVPFGSAPRVTTDEINPDGAIPGMQLVLQPEKMGPNAPAADFTHGAMRNQPLSPLEPMRAVLVPDEDAARRVASSQSFSRASRLTGSHVDPSSTPYLALDPGAGPAPSATGIRFGTEHRLDDRWQHDKETAQSVLHPELSDAQVRKSNPAWEFDHAPRFRNQDQAGDDADQLLQLDLDKSGMEPHIAEASMDGRPRKSDDWDGQDRSGQRLVLTPSPDATLPRHPTIVIGSEARFPRSPQPSFPTGHDPNVEAASPTTTSTSKSTGERNAQPSSSVLSRSSSSSSQAIPTRRRQTDREDELLSPQRSDSPTTTNDRPPPSRRRHVDALADEDNLLVDVSGDQTSSPASRHIHARQPAVSSTAHPSLDELDDSLSSLSLSDSFSLATAVASSRDGPRLVANAASLVRVRREAMQAKEERARRKAEHAMRKQAREQQQPQQPQEQRQEHQYAPDRQRTDSAGSGVPGSEGDSSGDLVNDLLNWKPLGSTQTSRESSSSQAIAADRNLTSTTALHSASTSIAAPPQPAASSTSSAPISLRKTVQFSDIDDVRQLTDRSEAQTRARPTSATNSQRSAYAPLTAAKVKSHPDSVQRPARRTGSSSSVKLPSSMSSSSRPVSSRSASSTSASTSTSTSTSSSASSSASTSVARARPRSPTKSILKRTPTTSASLSYSSSSSSSSSHAAPSSSSSSTSRSGSARVQLDDASLDDSALGSWEDSAGQSFTDDSQPASATARSSLRDYMSFTASTKKENAARSSR